jgi:phage-related protein
MSSIITSLKDLVTSVFEVIFSVFNGAIDMVSGLIMGLVNSVIGIVKMTLHTAGNLLEAAGGVGKFVASRSYTTSAQRFEGLISGCAKAISLSLHLLLAVSTVTCSIKVVKAARPGLEISH